MNNDGITPELVEDIRNMVKTLHNITDTSKDIILDMYINIICHKVLIYTNRNVFVEKLKYVIVDLVGDELLFNNDNDSGVSQAIQSMSEAGRSVNFGESDSVKYRLNKLADEKISINRTLLNRYKLLYRIDKKVGDSNAEN